MDPFADILGHDSAIGSLRSAMAQDRLPHGLLFAGPVGVGKFTVAAALAGAFLGGDSETVRRVANRTHADFHVVTRELVRFHDRTGKSKAINLSIDVIREELVRPASMHSVEGKGKVFVVEEAETMTVAAQNGMLKTLEEPAGRSLIILLTDKAERLLPTIRSRCQTFRFGVLGEAAALAVLSRNGVAASDARRAIAVAGGAPGRALKWLADGVVDRAGELHDLLDGRDELGRLAAWFRDAADAYAAKQLERDPLGSKDAFTREGLMLYLSLAAEHFRRRLPEVHEDTAESMCARIDAVARAEAYLSSNVNVALTFQQLELALRL